jgi:hypothetical protein
MKAPNGPLAECPVILRGVQSGSTRYEEFRQRQWGSSVFRELLGRGFWLVAPEDRIRYPSECGGINGGIGLNLFVKPEVKQ